MTAIRVHAFYATACSQTYQLLTADHNAKIFILSVQSFLSTYSASTQPDFVYKPIITLSCWTNFLFASLLMYIVK